MRERIHTSLQGGPRSPKPFFGLAIGRRTHRIGIVPNVEVRPTIAGIRAGRDEVLGEAVRQILGHKMPAAYIHMSI
jgi:hypothetical protein